MDENVVVSAELLVRHEHYASEVIDVLVRTSYGLVELENAKRILAETRGAQIQTARSNRRQGRSTPIPRTSHAGYHSKGLVLPLRQSG